MKKVLFTLMLLVSTMTCFAQEGRILENCKMDSTSEKLTLIGIDSVPNVSATDLYLRALTWISKTYKYPNSIIKSKDKDAGIIILNGYTISDNTKSHLELRFKDGKYRWVLTDFIIVLEYVRPRERPMEIVPRYTDSPDKELQLKKDCYEYITSLRKAMLQKDDW